MRIFLFAATTVLLSGAGFAQSAVPRYGEVDKDKSPSEIAAEKAAEQAYERSLGAIRDQGSADPWGAVRTTDAPNMTAAKVRATSKSPAAPN
jgi:hypothetical protein